MFLKTFFERAYQFYSSKKLINEDAHLKELIQGSSTAFLLRIFGFLVGYLFILIITRSFGADIIGLFAISLTILQITVVIGRLGIDTALLRFVAEYSSQQKWANIKSVYLKSIYVILPVGLVLSILLYFSSPIWQSMYLR